MHGRCLKQIGGADRRDAWNCLVTETRMFSGGEALVSWKASLILQAQGCRLQIPRLRSHLAVTFISIMHNFCSHVEYDIQKNDRRGYKAHRPSP